MHGIKNIKDSVLQFIIADFPPDLVIEVTLFIQRRKKETCNLM